VQIIQRFLKRPSDRAIIAMVAIAMAGAGCDQVAATISDAAPSADRATAVSFTARVVAITDGDTLTVLDEQNQQHTIRLAEIDAPERRQPWGDRSRQHLSALAFGKTVSIQQTDTDRYGRTVARVFANGEDINRAMVRDGNAWAYREYLTDQTLLGTEARARQAHSGLWSLSDAETVPPWQWRRGLRVAQLEANTVTAPPANPVRSLLGPRSNAQTAVATETFSCGSKRFCREMSSCAEAQFYLRQCGLDTIDGNDDGEPCEVLCGTTSR
jgi:endonuclease YncB( thermonuclease family)